MDWTNRMETMMGPQLPRHTDLLTNRRYGYIEESIKDNLDVKTDPRPTRSEDLYKSRRCGFVEAATEDYWDVKLDPRPTRSEDLHKSRRHGYVEAETEERRPSPVISNSKWLQAHKRYGYVEKDQTGDKFSRENREDRLKPGQIVKIIDKLIDAIISRENKTGHQTNKAMTETKEETMTIKQSPRPLNARSEDLHTRRRYGYVEQGNEEHSDVTTKPRPSRSEDLHRTRRCGYVEEDIKVCYSYFSEWILDKLYQYGLCPPRLSFLPYDAYMYIKQELCWSNQCQDIHVRFHDQRTLMYAEDMDWLNRTLENLYEQRRRGYAEQDISEAVPIEPIQYRFYKPEQFPRFQYIYNQIMDCKFRIEKAGIGRIRTHQMSENVIIKIGTIGDFTDKKCNLISKRKGRKTTPNGTTIWKAQPLVCFSESLKDDLCLKHACHTILIKSGTLSDTDQADDSVIIVGHNKEQIKDAITTCLEKPLHEMLQEWLEVFKNEPSNDTTSELIAEIEAIAKQMEFINRKYKNPDLNSKSIIPDDVKEYLYRMPGVYSFGIWGSSSFKIFVNKSDEKSLRDDLTKKNPTFFNKYKIEIENGKLQDKLTHLMQGDEIQAKIPNDDQKCYTGTLGGIVTKANDKSKKFALTCKHLFPKEGERAYNENLEDIGACLFTTDKNSCDFAAIEIEKSFSEKCDETFQNEDRKIINARVFPESLTNVGIVHKIGAATKVTKGRILSSEYYDKLFDDNNREHVFLVKGIPGNFSMEGDSGSLVFTRSKDARQTCVDVLGMVYGNKVTVYDDDDDDDDDVERKSKNKDDNECSNTSPSSKGDNAASNVKESENISSCYRIHTALDLFKENQREELKFKDDLLLSSPETSESDDCNEETSQ